MRIASFGTASVDQKQPDRVKRKKHQHRSFFNRKSISTSASASITLIPLYSLVVSCCILLYLVIYLLPLPAQPCGWCIRTRRVGRHHPRRLDLSLSLSLSLSPHTLSLTTTTSSSSPSSLSLLLSTISHLFDYSARCLCFQPISCAQNPNTG